MFFLLRLAFWLTIVLALLPSGGNQSSASGPHLGEAISAAGATVSDLRHFCSRNPDACEVGSQAAVMIGQRAQAGAKMLYEMFADRNGSNATGSVQNGKAPADNGTAPGTLTPEDRAPAWHGADKRKGGKPSA